MTQEEMERTMQFIVEQQAQFTADIQQLKERQDSQTDLVGRMAQAGIEFGNRANQYQQQTEARLSNLEIKMAQLAEAEKETQERLDAFIVFVEKYIASRNGKNGKEPH